MYTSVNSLKIRRTRKVQSSIGSNCRRKKIWSDVRLTLTFLILTCTHPFILKFCKYNRAMLKTYKKLCFTLI